MRYILLFGYVTLCVYLRVGRRGLDDPACRPTQCSLVLSWSPFPFQYDASAVLGDGWMDGRHSRRGRFRFGEEPVDAPACSRESDTGAHHGHGAEGFDLRDTVLVGRLGIGCGPVHAVAVEVGHLGLCRDETASSSQGQETASADHAPGENSVWSRWWRGLGDRHRCCGGICWLRSGRLLAGGWFGRGSDGGFSFDRGDMLPRLSFAFFTRVGEFQILVVQLNCTDEHLPFVVAPSCIEDVRGTLPLLEGGRVERAGFVEVSFGVVLQGRFSSNFLLLVVGHTRGCDLLGGLGSECRSRDEGEHGDRRHTDEGTFRRHGVLVVLGKWFCNRE